MAPSHSVPTQFPDDAGADMFVREFPTAVAPTNRHYLSTKPPLFILGVPDGCEQDASERRAGAVPDLCRQDEYERRVRRVLEALRQSVDRNGKLLPYAVLEAGAAGRPASGDGTRDTYLLVEEVADRLSYGMPPHMTPDRLPQFSLLQGVFADVMRRADGNGEAADAKALRDSAYARRVRRPGLPALLWRMGGGESAPSSNVYSWLLNLIWVPVTQTLPRWYWARRQTRRLIRPRLLSFSRSGRWLGTELSAERGGEDLFRVLDDVARRQLPRLQLSPGHPQREEALENLEYYLVRALLEDLRVPPVGSLLPRRRRRTARPVVLVELPRLRRRHDEDPAGTEAAAAAASAERFLRAYHRARALAQPPAPLVVAVGRPSATLLAELGDPEPGNLTQAGVQLNQRDGQPVLVELGKEPFTRSGLPIRQVEPKTYRTSWRTMTVLVVSATVLAASALGGWTVRMVMGPEDHTCVGGNGTADASGQDGPVTVRTEEWYDAAYDEIQKQNERAEEFAREGRTVRTVVHFGLSRPVDDEETLFDGTIPELRGVAMWQRRLNDEAVSDDSRVPLRVDVRTTGPGFQNAEKEARKLVEEVTAANEKGGGGPEQVIGVLGYAQSKEETRAALQVLGEAGIPAVGTTATADEMLDGQSYQSYWPFTPANSTEARVTAGFASTHDIVARPGRGGGCTPAEQAVVIQNSGDLYSRSLAEKFGKEFPGEAHVVNFSQAGHFPYAEAGTPKLSSAHDLAGEVCEALEKQPASVVYWSARARDFIAFANALDAENACGQSDITVLGGNELTNVALTGAFSDKHWLRLYYSAHRMPATDQRASVKTRQFVEDYDRFVAGTARGNDPWRQDGHSAVAYDALHVLSRAADVAYRDEDAPARAVLTALSGGISFDGATGHVAYSEGGNAPPADKTLVLLRQTSEGVVAVAACGAYREGEMYHKQGSPCASEAPAR